MTQKVLTIDQIKKLKELNFDFSHASCYFYKVWPNTFKVTFKDDKYNPDEDILTLTLEDILNVIPKTYWIKELQNVALLSTYIKNKIFYVSYDLNGICYHCEQHWNPFDALYKMLIWCLENKILVFDD